MALTSKNLPAPPKELSSSAPELDGNIVARPLVMPDFIDLKPKNPGVSFRWVNCSIGDEHSSVRYDQMCAMEFEAAVPEDILGQVPRSLIKNGHLRKGDLILMKIDKAKYLGAKKANWLKAQQKASFGQPEAQQKLRETLAEAGVRPSSAAAQKLSVFTPSEEEANALTGGKR